MIKIQIHQNSNNQDSVSQESELLKENSSSGGKSEEENTVP